MAAVAAGSALHWFVQHGTACESAEPAAPLPGSWLGDTFTLLRCHLPVRLEVFGVRVRLAPTAQNPAPAQLMQMWAGCPQTLKDCTQMTTGL